MSTIIPRSNRYIDKANLADIIGIKQKVKYNLAFVPILDYLPIDKNIG